MFNGSAFHYNAFSKKNESLRSKDELCSHEPPFRTFISFIFIVFQCLWSRYENFLFVFHANILRGRILCNQNITKSLPYIFPFFLLGLCRDCCYLILYLALSVRKISKASEKFFHFDFGEKLILKITFLPFLIYLFCFQIHSINLLSLKTAETQNRASKDSMAKREKFPLEISHSEGKALNILSASTSFITLCENNF